MILIDTGPLIALLDNRDLYHEQCLELFNQRPDQNAITTWPCFTETM